MTNPTDLIARPEAVEKFMRIASAQTGEGRSFTLAEGAEVIAYIERLESLAREVAGLREALEPFAEHPDFQAGDDWAITQLDDGYDKIPGVTVGDFRRARAALAEGGEKQ